MPPKKPTVYLDTSIISAYWCESHDVLVVGRRLMTREWWDNERQHFAIFASVVTKTELADGEFPGQEDCLKMVRRLRYLPMTKRVRDLANTLMQRRLVPDTKPGDGLQMAIAAIHEIDYLLTWNYSHLANPDAQLRLASVCCELQLKVPTMVSPESIPKVAFGESIRRKPK